MKSTKCMTRIAVLVLCTVALAATSFAASSALELPRGLAIDAKGNLYVANSLAHNILVYSPTYVLQKSKTIPMPASGTPWGLAFDHWGTLWVSDFANSAVFAFPSGQQTSRFELAAGLASPEDLAFDATGNLWIQNNSSYVSVFTPFDPMGAPLIPSETIPLGTIYGLAIGAADDLAIGTPYGAIVTSVSSTFQNAGVGTFITVIQSTGFAIATDAAGTLYIANLDGSVQVSTPMQTEMGSGTLSTGILVNLPFSPTGIAVDSVRGRVYISNYSGNSISVYSTSGTFLHVIQ